MLATDERQLRADLSRRPGDPGLLYDLGELLIRLDRCEEACELFARATEAYLACGNRTRALRAFYRVDSIHGSGSCFGSHLAHLLANLSFESKPEPKKPITTPAPPSDEALAISAEESFREAVEAKARGCVGCSGLECACDLSKPPEDTASAPAVNLPGLNEARGRERWEEPSQLSERFDSLGPKLDDDWSALVH